MHACASWRTDELTMMISIIILIRGWIYAAKEGTHDMYETIVAYCGVVTAATVIPLLADTLLDTTTGGGTVFVVLDDDNDATVACLAAHAAFSSSVKGSYNGTFVWGRGTLRTPYMRSSSPGINHRFCSAPLI